MTKNLWELKLQIDLPILWLQQLPKSNSEPQRCQLILQDHQHLFQRKKHILFPKRTFDLFLKTDTESECKQAEEKNCHFDWYIVKYALKKTTTQVLEQMRKTAPKTRAKGSVRNISERFTKETPKIIKKSKNASDKKAEGSKDTLCLYCLDAYTRSTSREMWFQCIECKLQAHEKCTNGSPRFICSIFQSDGSEYFV